MYQGAESQDVGGREAEDPGDDQRAKTTKSPAPLSAHKLNGGSYH